jgi:hypothetical protein
MARQQRLTRNRAATTRLHFGGASARAAGAGPRGMRLPRRCDGEHPGPTTRGVPEAAGAPSGEADEAARRRTRTATPEQPPRGMWTRPTAPFATTRSPQPHGCRRRASERTGKAGPSGSAATRHSPTGKRHPARAGRTQQRSEPTPGGAGEASGCEPRGRLGSGTGPTARSLRRAGRWERGHAGRRESHRRAPRGAERGQGRQTTDFGPEQGDGA